MATYTDNYTMTKPTYAEQADISVINANMDTIDDIMHSSQVSLADAYDLNSTYNTGNKVMYEMLMYKCKEDGVTGAWDASKWERTTAVEGSGADLDIYGEASGTAETSFSDGAEASLVECEIGIVPSQDLHGYSKPWAGGAGKNKLPSTGTSTTLSGVDYTVANDGTIDVDGLSSATDPFVIGTINITAGTPYTLSSGAENNNHFYVQIIGTGISGVNTQSGETTFTVSADTIGTARIVVTSGYDVDHVVIKPMVRTSGDSTYEPYSNICPISGHTDVTVTVASTSGGSGEDTTVSLGRTVYGGTLDVTTGELTVTRGNYTNTWNNGVSPANLGDYTRKSFTYVDLSKDETALNTYMNCAKLEGSWGGNNCHFLINTSTHNEVYVYLPNNTANDFQIQLSYDLATPQTFNLTKAQVKTLLGQNYVSHDGGGTISLVYVKKDSTIIPNPSDAEVPLTGLEISGKGFKITDARIPAPPTTNGAYVLTVTVSGGTPTYSWENA